MPDYNDTPVSRVDNLHHVEGLVSVSDRVARRKEEQQRKKERKEKKIDEVQTPDEETEQEEKENISVEDGHIDFRA
jgi:transcription antitermination factor NusG